MILRGESLKAVVGLTYMNITIYFLKLARLNKKTINAPPLNYMEIKNVLIAI